MRQIVVVLASLLTVALGKPGFLTSPLTLATLVPGAPVGPDGRVLDTPEVAAAKAEHAAAHLNERLNLEVEAARSSTAGVQLQTLVRQPSLLLAGGTLLVPGAPIGADGRVVDTPEVAVAKAAHAAAQVNERINLANEAARSGELTRATVSPVVVNGVLASAVSGATVGLDGRVQDTPEVAAAKAAHATAQLNERINLANEAVRSSGTLLTAGQTLVPLVANGVLGTVVPGATVGLDGRVQDTPEVAAARAAHVAAHVNEKLNLVNEAARSADAVAVAGTDVALAYGRLVY